MPEYSFLDARGLGAYEGKNLDSIAKVTIPFDEMPRTCFFGSKLMSYPFRMESFLNHWLSSSLWFSQVYESDSSSPNTKPPPTDDGTPNESVSDVFVRVTQLMSILETQYSGDTVIIVSPDSDNLSVLQAGLVGLDLRR